MLKGRVAQAVLAWLLGAYLSVALRTTRWSVLVLGGPAPDFAGRASIVAFWHERLALMPRMWLIFRARDPSRGARVLVSRHRDGRLIGAVLNHFHAGTVHGSSSRGGAAALRDCAAALAAGDHVVMTPDGPRGPRRQAASGVAQIAALAGVPVVAAAAQTTHRITLGSWDRMVLPLPFGRGTIVMAPPIDVPRRYWQACLPPIAAALDAVAAEADRLCPRPGAAAGGFAGAVLAGLWFVAGSLAALPLRPYLAARARRGKEVAARLPERWGNEVAPRPPGRLIWLHAASVGETISVLPVLHALRAEAPEVGLLLTTGSVTSAAIAAERLPTWVLHRFVPLDVPWWAARFVDHWRPEVGCFVESELWPNLIGAARARGVALAVLNGRLSGGSFARWRRLAPLARRLLGGFALIWARGEADAARFAALAGRAVAAPGDLKFAAPALPADSAALAALAAALGGATVWVAASLHPGEDAIICQVHARLLARFPDLVTVLVPRHPDRGAAIAADHPMPRRSLGQAPVLRQAYLADTLGELGLFYRLARCAFIGGSLVAHGGQNPLEAARLRCPVAMGPHRENFAEACAALAAAGGLAMADGAEGLAAYVAAMLSDPDAREAAAASAAAAADRWAGLPRDAARALLRLLPGGVG